MKNKRFRNISKPLIIPLNVLSYTSEAQISKMKFFFFQANRIICFHIRKKIVRDNSRNVIIKRSARTAQRRVFRTLHIYLCAYTENNTKGQESN